MNSKLARALPRLQHEPRRWKAYATAVALLAGLAVPVAAGTASAATVHTVTTKPGPLASMTVSPASATINPGGLQSYTAEGFDAHGNDLGDVKTAKFTIEPDGSCTGATCTASKAGVHTVTAKKGKVSGTATLTVAVPAQAQADLALTETVSAAQPFYYSPVTFTTTVTNTSTTTPSAGVTVTAQIPAGLINPAVTASQGTYAPSTGTWTVGTLAPGASVTLTFAGDAGDVVLGTQTVQATATATTADPNLANNTASASEASQPAQLGARITPASGNPQNIDIGLPGDVSWTGTAYNVENPAAPAPPVSVQWYCSTASGNPCPPTPATDTFNVPTITYLISQLQADTYTLTLTVSLTGGSDNYTSPASTTSLTFTTSNSGAG